MVRRKKIVETIVKSIKDQASYNLFRKLLLLTTQSPKLDSYRNGVYCKKYCYFLQIRFIHVTSTAFMRRCATPITILVKILKCLGTKNTSHEQIVPATEQLSVNFYTPTRIEHAYRLHDETNDNHFQSGVSATSFNRT